MPVDTFERLMPLREIAERRLHKPPWTRRLEIMLAQLAYVVARSAGVQVEPDEFDIFGPRPDPKGLKAEDSAGMFSSMVGGGPGVRVLGKKRREKQAKKDTHGDEPR